MASVKIEIKRLASTCVWEEWGEREKEKGKGTCIGQDVGGRDWDDRGRGVVGMELDDGDDERLRKSSVNGGEDDDEEQSDDDDEEMGRQDNTASGTMDSRSPFGSSSTSSSDFASSDSELDSSEDEEDQRRFVCSPSPAKKHHDDGRAHVSCFQEAQISPDGTCVFTTDFARIFSVYPLDPNLGEEEEEEEQGSSVIRSLKPYAKCHSADPIWSFAVNPYFDAQNAYTTTVLISRRDQYINLHNSLWDVSKWNDEEGGGGKSHDDTIPQTPIDISIRLASYKLICSRTEAILAPLSMTYSHCGAFFHAGHRNAISTFDLTHTDEPVSVIPTIPSARSKLKGGGCGFKGHISALALSSPSNFAHTGVLAAGSRTRCVGLYDGRTGGNSTHFELPGTLGGKKQRLYHYNNNNSNYTTENNPPPGDGITHLKWSPNGTYLYIAERKSDSILIYDARNFSLALGYCAGRAAHTNQKLGFDVRAVEDVYGVAEHEVWAGGADGVLRVWRDPWKGEGARAPDGAVAVEGRGDREGVERGRGGGKKGAIVSCLVDASGKKVVVARGACDVKEGVGDGSSWVARSGVTMRKEKDDGVGVSRYRDRYDEWGSLDVLGLEYDEEAGAGGGWERGERG